MNIDELQRKLLAAARSGKPDDAVPYAFEKRVMARLEAWPPGDMLALWNRALWRMAASCVAITVLLGVWTAVSPGNEGSSDSLAADLEVVVLAPFNTPGEIW